MPTIEAIGGVYVWHDGKYERRLPRYHSVEATKARPGLEIWKQKRLVTEVATNAGLREQALTDPYGAVRAALDGQGREAALGISVHTVTAEVDRGHWPTFTDEELAPLVEPGVDFNEVRQHVAQWVAAKRAHAIEIHAVERIILHERMAMAGTLDRIVTVPALLGTTPMLLDLKTGASVYPDVALQLATYARADYLFDEEADQAEPMPPVSLDWAVVAHLRPDACRLYPVRIDGAAWPTVESLRCLFDWESTESKRVLGDALAPITGGGPF